MIIKKINIEDLSEQLYSKIRQKLSSTTKFTFLQTTQQNEHFEQTIKQNGHIEQNISFNDRQQFNHQSLLQNMRRLKVDYPMHKAYIRQAGTKQRQQQLSHSPIELMAVHTEQITNLFQTFNQQHNSPDKTFYAQNIDSQKRVRNYSSLSFRNKKQSFNTINLNDQYDYLKAKLPSRTIKKKQDVKLRKSNISCYEINPYTNKKYLHKSLANSKGKKDSKMKSLDYSIIKPNQIVAAPLRDRNYLRIQFPQHNSASFKRNYPELIEKIKRKQDLLKRQILLQKQRQRAQKEERQLQMRRKMHSSYCNRIRLIPEENNEVLPWEGEGVSNMADIL